MKTFTYHSEYLFNRARQMVWRKGFVVVSKSISNGLIEVRYAKRA